MHSDANKTDNADARKASREIALGIARMVVNPDLGQAWVRAVREGAGVSQGEAAELLRTGKARVSRWENGRSPMDGEILRQYLTAFPVEAVKAAFDEVVTATAEVEFYPPNYPISDLIRGLAERGEGATRTFVRVLRDYSGATQKEVAKLLITSQDQVSRWETGRSRVTSSILLDYSHTFTATGFRACAFAVLERASFPEGDETHRLVGYSAPVRRFHQKFSSSYDDWIIDIVCSHAIDARSPSLTQLVDLAELLETLGPES